MLGERVSHTYSTSRSGLILAHEAMDGAALERALKQKDPQLRLQGWPSPAHGCILWRVLRQDGDDLRLVCIWQSDQGEPYPLSSGLLDMVDRLDKNTRSGYADEDERNRRREEEQQRQRDRDAEALRTDHLTMAGRLQHRSVKLRMQRDKMRARGDKV